jgi:hypothetical protein
VTGQEDALLPRCALPGRDPFRAAGLGLAFGEAVTEEETMGRKALLLGVVVLGICGCSVPGQVTFKYVNNKWEPDTATFARDNVSASDIKSMQDRLNAK